MHPGAAGLRSFTAASPLVLLTDFPPDAEGGGAVIIRSLLTAEDRKRIVWVTLSPLEHPAHDISALSLAEPGRPRSLLRDSTVRRRSLVKRLRGVMSDYGASVAWVVAHGASVRIAPMLSQAGVPVHLTVHDDPAWAYAILTRRYLSLAPLLARDCARALRTARSVDVVSEAMAARYRARFGCEAAVIHRGLVSPPSPAEGYDRSAGLSVAVLGSTYGDRELRSLAAALGLIVEREGAPTTLTVIGNASSRRLKGIVPPTVKVVAAGHLPEEVGIAALRRSFVLYLSYPFSARGRVLRRTSFPTKLSTYLMAARPLLLHMPADSGVAGLAAAAPYASAWESLDPEEGSSILLSLWRDPRAVESFHREAEAVRGRYFDLERNRARLLADLNGLVSPTSPLR